MRIIKNFHDYYDNVAGNNKEDPVIYYRKTEIFENISIPEIDQARRDTPYSLRDPFSKYSLRDPFSKYCSSDFLTRGSQHYGDKKKVESIISIAGKPYAGFALNEQINLEWYRIYKDDPDKKALFIRDEPTFRSFTKAEHDINSFFRGLEWFEKILDLTNLHTKLNSPVLRITVHSSTGWSDKNKTVKYTVEKDPLLQLMNFQTVVDPYTITQEIEMFVGGVLSNQQPQPLQTSDKDRLVAKGFDNRISFRHRK